MNKDIHTCTTSKCVHWLQTRHTQSYFPLYLKHLSCESHVIKYWWYPKKIIHNTIRLLLSCFYLSLMDIQISVLRSFVYETVLGSYSEIKASPVKAVYRSFWIFFFFSWFFFFLKYNHYRPVSELNFLPFRCRDGTQLAHHQVNNII